MRVEKLGADFEQQMQGVEAKVPAVPVVDLDHTPCEREAWEYLKAKNPMRDPLRRSVKRSELVAWAKAAGRQLTKSEVEVLIHDDVEMTCASTGKQFMGMAGMVFRPERKQAQPAEASEATEASESDEVPSRFTPILGLPDAVARLVARHADGSPKVRGSVANVPVKDDKERQTGWSQVPLSGPRYFVMRDQETGVEEERLDMGSPLGRYIRGAIKAGFKGYVYTMDGALKAAAARQERYQAGQTKIADVRKREATARATEAKIFGFDSDPTPRLGRYKSTKPRRDGRDDR